MNRSHLSDDEIIGVLYGLDGAEDHLASCPECGQRLHAMRKVRRNVLAAERRHILKRPDRRPFASNAWRWISVPAALAALALVLFISRPASVPPPAPAAVNAEADAALFTDVYSMEQEIEPRAAAPIRSLFQETSFEKEQP